MVRIIDSDAINKRVFSDIANTFQHSSKITGEKTVQDLSGTDDPRAAAVDNFNFNGIEFSKIKQLINLVQTLKKKFYIDEQLVEITNNKEENLNYFTESVEYKDENDNPVFYRKDSIKISKKGIVINDYKKQFVVPDSFDGRNSFVIPSFALVPKITDVTYTGTFAGITIPDDTIPSIGQTEQVYLYLGAGGHTWNYRNMYDKLAYMKDSLYQVVGEPEDRSPFFYKPNLLKSMRFGLTEKRNIFDREEFIKCWAASMDSSDGNNCLVVDKNKNAITITASLNLANKNTGFDRSGTRDGGLKMDNRRSDLNVADFMRDNCIARVYLHVLFVYWRDK